MKQLEASPIGRPLTRCPECGSAALKPMVESFVHEVHFLCQVCGRCWQFSLGSVRRIAPASCLGCPERSRCEAVYANDHPEVAHRAVRS